MGDKIDYERNQNLEYLVKKIGANIVYDVGLKFLYTPVSETFKKTFFNYLKNLSEITEQSLEIDFKKSYSNYFQKRKEPRFKPSDRVPMLVKIDGFDSIDELLDISLHGLRFRTSKAIIYGQEIFLTIQFEKHQLAIFAKISYIKPSEKIVEVK